MKITFYKIECLTNLHVGAGDINYNIIDNEVEKDPVTGMPMIHASGIKGALRDYAKNNGYLEDKIKDIFGSIGDTNTTGEGTYKFFDAHLLARPMRVVGDASVAFLPVVTTASVNQFIKLLTSFGNDNFKNAMITENNLNFKDNYFLTNVDGVKVEGDKTAKLDENKLSILSKIIGDKYAIAKTYDGYDLPVVARNALDNGVSKNLWYEEVVPHGSVFYFAVMSPKDNNELDLDLNEKIVQFGGHASIGCGFTKVTMIGEGKINE